MDEAAQRLLAELSPLARGGTVLDAVAVAVAVEDSFHIVLADQDIKPDALCSPEALAGTLARYLDRP
jgi:hypothetical protein